MATKGPVLGLKAAPQPSWLQAEEPEQEPPQSSMQNSGQVQSGSSGDARAYVYFTTDLPEPLKLPQEPLSVETTVRRADLSRLVNALLKERDSDAWPHPQPLDFLVEAKTFLRGSLGEHMKEHGLTAEVSIHLHYQLACRRGEERVLPPARDWISGVAVPRACGPVIEASYDGHLRLHSASSPEALLSHDSVFFHDVPLQKGPLAGVACVDVGGSARGPLACFAVTQGGGLLALSLLQASSSSPSSTKGAPWNGTISFVGVHGGPAACVAASADARLAAVGGTEGTITLWDTSAAAAEAKVASAQAASSSSSSSNSSSSRQKRHVAAVGEATQCRALPSPVRVSASSSSQRVTDIKFGAGLLEGHFVSASLDGSLRLWDLGGDASAHWRCDAVPLSVSFSPFDGNVLAVAHEDYRVRLWDIRTPEGVVGADRTASGLSLNLAFKGRHARLPAAVSWSSNANLLASVGQDGCVLVQDIRSPAFPLVVFKAEVGGLPVRLLCCDWLGELAVASGGSDGRVRLHGIVSGLQPNADL